MAPSTLKFMSYLLPAVTVAFTWALPAGLQLSFLISGVLSFVQSTLFQKPAFREAVGMFPLPPKPTPGVPVSPYNSTIRLAKSEYRADDLNYQAPRGSSPTDSTLPGVRLDSEPQEKKTLLGGAVKDVKSTFESIKKSATDTKKSAEEWMGAKRGADGKRTKQELAAADAYEKKRSAEEAKKRWEDEQRRRIQRKMRK
jgi:YidC/Oxa1 family membrane protein insertase